jgi:hypothetical protein
MFEIYLLGFFFLICERKPSDHMKNLLLTILSVFLIIPLFALDGNGPDGPSPDSPEVIVSGIFCPTANADKACEGTEEQTMIYWSEESIKIVRADGSVFTYQLTRKKDMEVIIEGKPAGYFYSTTDIVTSVTHNFMITALDEAKEKAGHKYNRKIIFQDGNNNGDKTTFYGHTTDKK